MILAKVEILLWNTRSVRILRGRKEKNKDMETNTIRFIRTYLECIGIEDAFIEGKQDDMGYLVVIKIPSENHERIGVLKGKRGNNLKALKQMARIVGAIEKKNPQLFIDPWNTKEKIISDMESQKKDV